MMPLRWTGFAALSVILFVTCLARSATTPVAIKMSSVASTEDLEAEATARVVELEEGTKSREAYESAGGKLRLSAVQLTVVAHALTVHDQETEFRRVAPTLRDAALQFETATSYEDAVRATGVMRAALAGTDRTSEIRDIDWSKLARPRQLMDSLRQRTELVRKAIRRSKDPVVESRHAATMAVLMIAVAAHADDAKYATNSSAWQQLSLEGQSELTETAAALRRQDASAVLEHFTAAQAACDRCHEKFKR